MSSLYVAKNTGLSYAWTEVFLKLMQPGVTKLAPVVVTISEFDGKRLPTEGLDIRNALDNFLQAEQQKISCRAVASTIFPNSLWRSSAPDNAKDLYDRYEKVWPRIKRCRLNRCGVYFRRMTAYNPRSIGEQGAPVNQLEHVIKTFQQGNHRHSALQASIFDPTRDHTHARQRGFPCLQQVAFRTANEELEVTGFYALQHHVDKAYGNYLGLCWLGRFMAQQMGLRLTTVTCIASVLSRGNFGKGELAALMNEVKNILAGNGKQGG